MPVATLAPKSGPSTWPLAARQAVSEDVLRGMRVPGFKTPVSLVGDCQQPNLGAHPAPFKTASDAGYKVRMEWAGGMEPSM
jgi:hypothetical protein